MPIETLIRYELSEIDGVETFPTPTRRRLRAAYKPAIDVQGDAYLMRSSAASSDTRTSVGSSAGCVLNSDEDGSSILKKFDGYVLSIEEESFIARLESDEFDEPPLEAEFGLDELSQQDRDLLQPGAPLVWTLTAHRTGGTLSRKSSLYIRRIQCPTQSVFDREIENSHSYFGGIQWA